MVNKCLRDPSCSRTMRKLVPFGFSGRPNTTEPQLPTLMTWSFMCLLLAFLPSPSYSPYSCFLESPPASLGRRGGSKLRQGHVCYTYFLKSLKAMNIKVRKAITSWRSLRAEELGDRGSARRISRELANILSRPDCGSTCAINRAVRFGFCTFLCYIL